MLDILAFDLIIEPFQEALVKDYQFYLYSMFIVSKNHENSYSTQNIKKLNEKVAKLAKAKRWHLFLMFLDLRHYNKKIMPRKPDSDD